MSNPLKQNTKQTQPILPFITVYILPSTRLLVMADQTFFISLAPIHNSRIYLFHLKLKYSHFKWFTSRVPFACIREQNTDCGGVLFGFVVTKQDYYPSKVRANDTNQIMNLYKWNTEVHRHTNTHTAYAEQYIISKADLYT